MDSRHSSSYVANDWAIIQSLLNSDATKDQDLSTETYQSHVRAIKRALHTLTDALDVLHRRMYPKYLQHGLASLPDDLLLEIFAWSETHPLLLRAVSRRFYQLVAQSPSLWAYYPVDISVKSDYPPVIPASTTVTLSHCGTLPLHLHINDIGQGLISEETLELLTAHAHRAHTLEYLFDLVWTHDLNFHVAHGSVAGKGERAGKRVRLEFPRMKRLRLVADTQARRRRRRLMNGEWDDSDADTDMRFTQHWYAPVLEDLIVSGSFLPHHIPGSALTRCTLHFATSHVAVDVTRLSAFLASSNCNASLHELKLVFGYSLKMFFYRSQDPNTDADADADADTQTPLVPVELSALTTFTLSLRTYRFENEECLDPFYDFLSTLHTPNLSTLNLELDVENVDRTPFRMQPILSFLHKNVNIAQLSFSLGRTPSINSASRSFDLPTALFEPLRCLKHLTVEAQCILVICYDLKPAQIPSELETLVLRRCFSLEEDSIEQLAMGVCRARMKGLGGDGGEREEAGEGDGEDERIDDGEKYKMDVPFTIIFEGCPQLDRRTVETKCLYEGIKGVWRDTVPDSNNED